MEEKIVKRCAEYAAHFAGLCDIACGVLDSAAQKFVAAEPGRRFCEDCAYSRCEELQTHLYGCSEAYRWNGKYIYYCPLGLVFVASSVSVSMLARKPVTPWLAKKRDSFASCW